MSDDRLSPPPSNSLATQVSLWTDANGVPFVRFAIAGGDIKEAADGTLCTVADMDIEGTLHTVKDMADALIKLLEIVRQL